MCLLDQLAPCTAHEEQSNGWYSWYGMATKQGTNCPGGEQIHGLEKSCTQGKGSCGTNSLGNKSPLTPEGKGSNFLSEISLCLAVEDISLLVQN